ncbi:hypothetical protein ASE04_03865 [Rhizobium sp. Root708]|nr:hypothetical protein ASE04_03865 [Rhizobium sp. Root708]
MSPLLIDVYENVNFLAETFASGKVVYRFSEYRLLLTLPGRRPCVMLLSPADATTSALPDLRFAQTAVTAFMNC